ncbi:rho GTPase-activating protein 2 [Senna tora]|uniref:Rho GTPase-activating protein 2 n=1 Tax=Senna tora TaxID=362788 RepID=A0A834W3V7_9FABA|nr:rho GTPase-activating protein 2 [Senna tora]
MARGSREGKKRQAEKDNKCIVPLILGALRKSMVSCRVDAPMETGWPTDVHHITHVTFDRFHGFLGLPPDLQLHIPPRVPSASKSVFGVSVESMQCSYDSKGNSIPTILLLMQQRLYSQGGLKAEGIFRINPENGEEENLREQLNRGIVGEEMEVHCLAGLIKAWFRELPSGILDGLSPQQVLECNTEEEYMELVKQLEPTQSALLQWAVDLMADVVQHQHHNKMNSRNIAMVFAPNMTQMSDPLTALMHAVQVMNLLNTLITNTLTQREQETAAAGCSPASFHSYESEEMNGSGSGEEDHQTLSNLCHIELEEFSVHDAIIFTDTTSTSANSCSTSPFEQHTILSAFPSIHDTTTPSMQFTSY